GENLALTNVSKRLDLLPTREVMPRQGTHAATNRRQAIHVTPKRIFHSSPLRNDSGSRMKGSLKRMLSQTPTRTLAGGGCLNRGHSFKQRRFWMVSVQPLPWLSPPRE